MPEEQLYELAGARAIQTFLEHGYSSILETLGTNFFSFLSNLDSLHENFMPSFPKMKVKQMLVCEIKC